MKVRKIYLDPTAEVQEFPPGLFEVYTPASQEGQHSYLISPIFAGKTTWQKRHTMLRFYIGRRGFVFVWRERPGPSGFDAKNGMISVGFWRFVFNSFLVPEKK
jgi:hypothetical protein